MEATITTMSTGDLLRFAYLILEPVAALERSDFVTMAL